MDNGWIKLHRQIEDHPLYFAEKFTKIQAWIDLLIIANHKDNCIDIRGNIVEIKRGQFARGENNLAKRWKWSREKVRRFMSDLETRQQIRQQKSRIITLYTVINYDRYQENETTNETTEKQQTRQQKNINKNVKNVKNVIKEKNTKKKNPNYTDDFEHFWKQYNLNKSNAGAKFKTFLEWKKLSEKDIVKAFDKIAGYRQSVSSPQYMKHAERYLRDRLFDNDYLELFNGPRRDYSKNAFAGLEDLIPEHEKIGEDR